MGRIEELENLLKEKDKDIEMYIQERDAAVKIKDDWKTKYDELKRRFDICKAHNDDAEKKISDLQERCQARYKAIEKLYAEKAQLKDVIESLRKEVDDLCVTVNILQSEKKEAQEIIADRTKDVQHYDEENKRLKENNEILQKAYDEKERSAVEWCNRYNNTEAKYRRLTVLIGEFVRQAVEL